MNLRSNLLWVLLAALAVIPASANAADKSAYTLFNPTPDSLLRDVPVERLNFTESPFTVDAGRWLIESDLYNYVKSRPDVDGITTRLHEFPNIYIRAGVTHNIDIELIWQPVYGVTKTNEPTRDEGIGGLELRGKLNLFGNNRFEDPGDRALALLPFITIPTDRNNGISTEDVEGGLIVPFAVVLSDSRDLYLNAGISAVKDDDGDGYHAEGYISAALEYEWNDRIGTRFEIAGIHGIPNKLLLATGFTLFSSTTPTSTAGFGQPEDYVFMSAELTLEWNDRFGTWYEILSQVGTNDPQGEELILGTGAGYAINDNLALDAGIYFGVTEASARYNPFVGLTRRF